MENKKLQFFRNRIWAACLESLSFSLLFAGLTIGIYLLAGDWYLLLRIILFFAFLLSAIYSLSDYRRSLVFQSLGFFIPVLVVSLLVSVNLSNLLPWLILAIIFSTLILYFSKHGNWLALGWQLIWNSLSLVLYYFLSI